MNTKECPHCHETVDEVYQCQICDMMFCWKCRGTKDIISESIGSFIPGVRCPRCLNSHSRVVSVNDYDSDDSSDSYGSSSDDSNDSYSSSPDDLSYSSSDSNDYSSAGGWGEGLIALIVIIVIIIVGAIVSSRPKIYENQPLMPTTQHTDNPVRPSPNEGLYSQYDTCSQQSDWVLAELCRSKELTMLNHQVLQLQSIYDMAEDGHAQSFENIRWQNRITATCKDAPSPSDCLRSALEDHSQWLQKMIPQALVSSHPTIFRDDAHKRWEKYKRENAIPELKTADELNQVQVEQGTQKQAVDRAECRGWAVAQTGYNPTIPSSSQKYNNYYRAMSACLEGRGYTTK